MQIANDVADRNSLRYFVSSFSNKLLMTTIHKFFLLFERDCNVNLMSRIF